jgi:hypothetical protein
MYSFTSNLIPMYFSPVLLYKFVHLVRRSRKPRIRPCYMPCPSQPPRLHYCNYTWRRVQIMKLFVMKIISAFHYSAFSPCVWPADWSWPNVICRIDRFRWDPRVALHVTEFTASHCGRLCWVQHSRKLSWLKRLNTALVCLASGLAR